MYNQKSLLVGIVTSLIVGVVIGLIVSSKSPQLSGGLSATQLEKVKKLFPVIPEMRSFSGSVKEIDGKTITLEISESTNPFDEWTTIRKVTVSDSTKIVRTSQKDPKEFQKEMEAYSPGAVGDSTKPSSVRTPPSFLTEKVIKLSDLKVGDVITVEADHNIKNETQFTATKVSVGMGGPAGLAIPPAPAGASTNLPPPPLPPQGGLPVPTNLLPPQLPPAQ